MRAIFAAVLAQRFSASGASVQLAAMATAAAVPCASAPYHEFDIWPGGWASYVASGVRQGHDRVEKILKGCVPQEYLLRMGDGAVGPSFPAGAGYRIRVDMPGVGEA
jgi:hypothetical protein